MPMINLDQLKQILEMVREHELDEFELEGEGLKLRLRKHGQVIVQQAAVTGGVPVAVVSGAAPAIAAPAASAEPAAADVDVDMELAIVKSPIVGTFYRAPDPNAPPFVSPGDAVRKGQTLCIIEAMKMMNNIDSEYEGTIVKVYVENGHPVQFGERLFAIKRK
jgi:acetyl-CoA carboxylase biotin carboxyl carrier protein